MTKHPTTALVTFRGGPLDGGTGTVPTHQESCYDHSDGSRYVVTDEQQGDHRVYRYAPGDGEPLPTAVVAPVEGETTLDRDMRELAAQRKASEKK